MSRAAGIVVLAITAVACSQRSLPVDAPAPASDRFLRLVEELVTERQSMNRLDDPFSVQALSGPAGEVVGVVHILGTDRPLPGVQVSADGSDLAALSDSGGRFRLSGVPVGRSSLTASLVGYVQLTVPLEVPEIHSTMVVLRMEEISLGHCPIFVSDGGEGSIWVKVGDAATRAPLTVPITLRVSDGMDEWTVVNGSTGNERTEITVAGDGRGPFVLEVSARGYLPWLKRVPRIQPDDCPPWRGDVWLRRPEH